MNWREWYMEVVGLANEEGLSVEEYTGGIRKGDEFLHSLFTEGMTPREAMAHVRKKAAQYRHHHGAVGHAHGVAMRHRGKALRRRYGHMKRPVVLVTVKDEAGNTLHSETKSAWNSARRASEAAVRKIALAEHTVYERGERLGSTKDADGDWVQIAERWTSREGKPIFVETLRVKGRSDS